MINLDRFGGWDIAEDAHVAPWIIVASTAGLTMSFYGMHEDNKRYKRSGYGKIVRNHARNPEYPQDEEKGA